MSFFKKIVEFFFKLYGLFEVTPVNSNSLIKKELPVNFKSIQLKLDDFEYFEKANVKQKYLEIYRKRLSSGSFICFAIIDITTNNLAYYCWLNQNETYYCKEINKTIKLKRNNSCLFEDDNTMNGYRNLGLHTFMMRERLLYCLKQNISKVYIVIYLKNIPALKTIKKFNFKRINLVPIYIRKEAFTSIYRKYFHD